MSDIEIEIDGKKLLTQPDKMVIQVADEAGIYIPRFCYHKHLSIAANCRMCLVEVEKSPKTLPACATPVMAGMKVFTRSPKALAAQRAVMEFLLINHPLDCPICDQGGECELQDLSLGYGRADSYYVEGKRSVKDENLGPLVATEMTRCIQCSRCIRFGQEIAGRPELGFAGRGEHSEVRSYLEKSMLHSEVSGNIIDLCPVGALTSKPFRFTARAWELQQYPSIAPHDCLGSHLNIHTREGRVMRVVPRENNNINQVWLSDRDRFAYEGLYHSDRLTKPLVKKQGRWQETDWQTALNAAAVGLKKAGEGLAALSHPSATLEEFYLLQKLTRALGASFVDHRLRQSDFTFVVPASSLTLDELEKSDVIVLIGSNIQKEQPLAALRVRKAALKGAQVISINMQDYDFNFKVTSKIIAAPHRFVSELEKFNVNEPGKKVAVVLGALSINHPEARNIFKLAEKISDSLLVLTEGANARGAHLAGMLPSAIDERERTAYVLLNVEPDLDCGNPQGLIQRLEKADCVIALSIFKNDIVSEHADVIFPIAPFTETSGTFVNTQNEWQTFKGAASPYGESRPAWKVLRVLGNLLHLEGFDYTTSEEVRDEVKSKKTEITLASNGASFTYPKTNFSRIGELPIYATDSITRRAKALTDTQTLIEGELPVIRMHPKAASALGIKENNEAYAKQDQAKVRLPVRFDESLPLDAVWIPAAMRGTSGLPNLFGPIEIEKA